MHPAVRSGIPLVFPAVYVLFIALQLTVPIAPQISGRITPSILHLQGIKFFFYNPAHYVMAGDHSMQTPVLRFRDGHPVPMLAFGTGTAWFKDPDDHDKFDPGVVQITKDALEAGFRHIDCAEMYGNEPEVGQALSDSGIPRNELFITTKVADGIKDIPKAINESLRKLRLDYVDLYLIHEPWNLHTAEDYQNAWHAMEEVKSSGKAKSIGVSNFVRKDLDMILNADPRELPAVNQLEYHPYLQRENDGVPYILWLQEQEIQVEAFKGLSALVRCPEGPLIQPLERMTQDHGVSASAVMLRWLLQQNVVAITTTRKKERLQEYAEALNFELTSDEMAEIFAKGKTVFKRFYFPERYDPNDRS